MRDCGCACGGEVDELLVLPGDFCFLGEAVDARARHTRREVAPVGLRDRAGPRVSARRENMRPFRDELGAGKSVRGAVDIGFTRAFTAILDGHSTTAMAGIVLLQFGSGPIKGFAVMLLVGIVSTLFTNVWASRLFFDWYLAGKADAKTISI